MQKLIIVLVSSLTISFAFDARRINVPGRPNVPDPPKKDPNTFDYKITNPGILQLKTQGTLFDNGVSKIDGSGSLYKNFADRRDPIQVGGGLKYNHLPSNTGAGVNVVDMGPYGTNVQAELTKTLQEDRFSNFEGGLSYGQQFSRFGNSEPTFGGFIRGTF